MMSGKPKCSFMLIIIFFLFVVGCATHKIVEKNPAVSVEEFFYAVQKNDLLEAERMIIEGVNVNAKNTKKYTPLMLAAEHGNIDTLKLLLNAGADINTQGCSDWTALTTAAFEGHTDAVRTLIEAGADIELKDYEGFTAMMITAMEGKVDVIKLLLDKGALITAKDQYGKTALMLAEENSNENAAQVLREAVKELFERVILLMKKEQWVLSALVLCSLII